MEKLQAEHIKKMKERLTQVYVTHNAKDKTYEEFWNNMDRDNFMTAEEARNFGIIDTVPEMTVPKPAPNLED